MEARESFSIIKVFVIHLNNKNSWTSVTTLRGQHYLLPFMDPLGYLCLTSVHQSVSLTNSQYHNDLINSVTIVSSVSSISNVSSVSSVKSVLQVFQ